MFTSASEHASVCVQLFATCRSQFTPAIPKGLNDSFEVPCYNMSEICGVTLLLKPENKRKKLLLIKCFFAGLILPVAV